MHRGKHICRILKEIRRQIADANDIDFVTSECRYKGDCNGTCPKCEAEVRYLEQELRSRSHAGKAVSLAGISVASLAMFMPIANQAHVPLNSSDSVCQKCSGHENSIEIAGAVYYDEIAPDGTVLKESLIGVIVLNRSSESAAATDSDGRFKLNACVGDTLEISYIGFKTQTITISEDTRDITITLESDDTVIGEVIAGMVSAP